MDETQGKYGISGTIPAENTTHIIAACGMIINDLLMEAAKEDTARAIALGREGYTEYLKQMDPTFKGLYDSTQLLLDMRSAEAKRAAGAKSGTDSFAQPFGFGGALHALQRGHQVHRQGWNGKGMWLELQVPDAGSKMTLPYIYMSTISGDLVPWLASQTDMLAKDWEIA